uniref:Expressed protein n=1 Tax=Oryza sativa subsp. japonica TaxID=39947 RepID=Q2R9A2_ORYSJ|nr:expressed protein [Oryza sativa Japonica Group]
MGDDEGPIIPSDVGSMEVETTEKGNHELQETMVAEERGKDAQPARSQETEQVHLSIDSDSYELEDVALVSQHLMRLDLCSVVLKDYFLNFLCCPVLKELLMRKCCIKARKISSESLKRLTAVDCSFYSYPRVRIFLPSLVALELTGPQENTPVLESMPSLLTESIELTYCDDHCGKEEFGGLCDYNACDSCGANGGSSGYCAYFYLKISFMDYESLNLYYVVSYSHLSIGWNRKGANRKSVCI